MFGWFSWNKTVGTRGETIPARNDGLPDTGTLSGFCPRCKTQSSFANSGALPLTFSEMTAVGRDGSMVHVPYDQVAVLICRHCHQGMAVIEEQMTGEYSSASNKGGGQMWWRGVHWWPFPGGASDPSIPPSIRDTFDEACRAIAADCPRAGAVMARRTLEAVADDHGQTAGPLYRRLETLTQSGLLPATFADWAKEVRLVGNVGAHFDAIQDVSKQDAEQIRDFISELLNHLYILPSKLAARRASSANRVHPTP